MFHPKSMVVRVSSPPWGIAKHVPRIAVGCRRRQVARIDCGEGVVPASIREDLFDQSERGPGQRGHDGRSLS